MNPWPDLRPVLQGIPWVVVGAVATRAYMPERATKDIDILVRLNDGNAVRARLESAGYKAITARGVPGYLFQSPEGIELDVIFGEYPWIEEALAHPRHDTAGYPVLDLPYLVIMKLEASRVQDTADLSRMLGLASDEDLGRVRAIVTRYAPHDLDDLESLIYLGKVEMEGVRGGERTATLK